MRVALNEAFQSRLTGWSTILLSKRVEHQDGSFAGVLVAAIDSDYFNGFYQMFQLGPDGGITLIRSDGVVLIRWPLSDATTDLSKTDLFNQTPSVELGRVVQDRLAVRRHLKIFRLRGNAAIPRGRHIILLAAVLSSQFRFRSPAVHRLRENESRYRLLANNIADIIILIDARGILRFVSHSAEPVLGLRSQDLIGTSCFALVQRPREPIDFAGK